MFRFATTALPLVPTSEDFKVPKIFSEARLFRAS
jgi:hypothetical protein